MDKHYYFLHQVVIRYLVPLVVVVTLFQALALAGTTGKINGKVLQASSKEPLPAVNITIVGTTLGASSDLQGEYFIANVPPGVYTLKASIVGFTPTTITNVRVRIDASTEVNFSMEETVLEVGKEMLITAERPLVEKDNTASRTIMESGEIVNRPLQELSSVLVTLPSINNENGVLKVRGGTLDQISVLIDGTRARNPLDQTPYTNINLSSIQEMEIITGSFNAEYGEAQSGVFNIITKDGSERYTLYSDFRFTPPGKKHWGTALYDYSSPLYWENSHARHLQWWIDNPSQWVDASGIPGNDPRTNWTPEQAYNYYMTTHQPLNDYLNTPGYQLETSLGGPIPQTTNLYFFLSGKYAEVAPVYGNSFLNKGKSFDGTAKLSYSIGSGKKIVLSGFYGSEKTAWGVDGQPDEFYSNSFGLIGRYAYYDSPGLPETETDGQTLKFTNVLDQSAMYEIRVSRTHAFRKVDVLPGDPVGWAAGGPTTTDNLRAVDSAGNQIIGAYQDPIGYNTLGYWTRHTDYNTDWATNSYYSDQLTKNWQFKAGIDFDYYNIDHYNVAKAPDRLDSNVYHPYQGAMYAQSKLEFGGLIVNAGLRYDFYNTNNVSYTDLFDPLNSPTAPTPTYSQLSPRLGVSHPIDEKTVLHFSYGHFFERGPFGDYGEGTSDDQARGSITTYTEVGSNVPYILGNRNIKPQKTVAYEVGIERNFAESFVLGVTAFYKDITNTIRVIAIQTPHGLYKTNGNGDYADVRGFELSLRKTPTMYAWGALSGNVNFSTQLEINGRSGDPTIITPTEVRNNGSGDDIYHHDPTLKAAVNYRTPGGMNFLAGALNNISISLDFSAVFPNNQILGDFFLYNGMKFLRPADRNTNMKISKEFTLAGVRWNGYFAVQNLFNDKWLNLRTFYNASPEDQERFVMSGFKDIPSYTASGVPFFEMGKYRNLPRAIFFGATMEL